MVGLGKHHVFGLKYLFCCHVHSRTASRSPYKHPAVSRLQVLKHSLQQLSLLAWNSTTRFLSVTFTQIRQWLIWLKTWRANCKKHKRQQAGWTQKESFNYEAVVQNHKTDKNRPGQISTEPKKKKKIPRKLKRYKPEAQGTRPETPGTKQSSWQRDERKVPRKVPTRRETRTNPTWHTGTNLTK